MRIVVGADDAGAAYKARLMEDLRADVRVSEVIDVNESQRADEPYPGVAIAAARLVSEGRADRAILVCGTGLGMAIAANKVEGIRAVTAHDSYSVERSVLSNNAQILAMGQRVVGIELARRLVGEWIGYSFDTGSGSAAKVAAIDHFERSKGQHSPDPDEVGTGR